MADRPALSDKEIEITPEMIEAGGFVAASEADDCFALGFNGPGLLAIRVYRAMYALAPGKRS
jgi:hypothetical protein